jgi:rubrerythrin
MLLMMLERGESIHSVVWFDTGWEFPQMQDDFRKHKPTCPECGAPVMMTEGCQKCPACGWSACG